MAKLDGEYRDLRDEITVGSVADNELAVAEFFRLYSEISAENGDTPDLEYSPILRPGAGGYRIDGYAFEFLEDGSAEHGDLYVAVCDFRQDDRLPGINAKGVESAVDGVERFLRRAQSRDFLAELEETSPAFQLAMVLHEYWGRIRRIRVVVFSNAELRTRRNVFDSRDFGDRKIHINVLDLARYVTIATAGSEPVEVDFVEDFGGPLPCLPASMEVAGYNSYLFAIPGSVLAEVYAAYGNRLLEQNVRTYLQARTNVNKGILKTIADEPEMFFAYNNGITATASEVVTRSSDQGLGIERIKDLQVVNGGQTTASLLYARDGQNKSLDNVWVQVKLSVVEPECIEEVVPRIAEYANTQNKVSTADLASNSPVQVAIEKLSKEVGVPQKAGELHAPKWFYERARGQYKNVFAYKSRAERKKLELQYPRAKLVTKTDLAKYDLAFAGRPHHVAEGAQKCFNRYTTTELRGLKPGSMLNEVWFQRAMAKALLFRELDGAIQRCDWYKADRGYKSQIVAYTVAACADGFRSRGHQIDLDAIWRIQEVPAVLLDWMLDQARAISGVLRLPPEGVRNISEFSKKEFCWTLSVKDQFGQPSRKILQFGTKLEDFAAEMQSSAKEEKAKGVVDEDLKLFELMPVADELIARARVEQLLSPKNERALRKIAGGNINLARTERNALKSLLERLNVDLVS